MKKSRLAVLLVVFALIFTTILTGCAKKNKNKREEESKKGISLHFTVDFPESRGTSPFTQYAVYEDIDWSQVKIQKRKKVSSKEMVNIGEPVSLKKEWIQNLAEIESAIDKPQTVSQIPVWRGSVKVKYDGILGTFSLRIVRKRHVFKVANEFVVSDEGISFDYDSGLRSVVEPHEQVVTAKKLGTNIAIEAVNGEKTTGERFIKKFSVTKQGYIFKEYIMQVYSSEKGNDNYSLTDTKHISKEFNENLIFRKEDDEKKYLYKFTPQYEAKNVTFKYHLNLPEDRELITGESDPQDMEDVTVNKVTGKIANTDNDYELPDGKILNKYKSHSFKGWYKKVIENGVEKEVQYLFKLGEEKSDVVDLYAHWNQNKYKAEIYTYGGNFGKTYEEANAFDATNDPLTEGVSAESEYADAKNFPSSFVINGIPFGKEIGDVVTEIEIFKNSGKSIKKRIKLSDLFNKINKAKGAHKEGWYKNNTFASADKISENSKIESIVTDGKVRLFPKWAIDDAELSSYIIDAAFYNLPADQQEPNYKPGHEINSDGTVSLLNLKDTTTSNLKIPEKVKVGGVERYVSKIGGCAGLTYLTSIDMSESKIREILPNAFEKSSRLSEVLMTNTIKKIGRDAFKATNFLDKNADDSIIFDTADGKYLYKATTPSANNTIDLSAENISIVGVDAFDNFKELETRELNHVKKVVLGDKVTKIYDNAFSYLKNLEELDISSTTIEYMSETALQGTKLLDDKFGKEEDVIFGNALYRVTKPNITEYTIPATVTTIADRAFKSQHKLKTVNNLDGVQKIGKYAFKDSLEFLNKHKNSEGLVVVNKKVIANLSQADVIHVDEDIEEIVECGLSGQHALNLKELFIYSKKIKISNNAFADNKNLKKVAFISKDATMIDGDLDIDVDSINLKKGSKIYLQGEVLSKLKTEVENKTVTELSNTNHILYKENIASFLELKIANIEINESVVSTKYLRRKVDYKVIDDIFKDPETSIEKGIKIGYGDGLLGKAYGKLEKTAVEGKFSDEDLNKKGSHEVEFEIVTEIKTKFTYSIYNAPDETKPIQITGLKNKYFTSDIVMDITNAYISYTDIDGTAEKIKLTENDVSTYKNEPGEYEIKKRFEIEGWGEVKKENGDPIEVVHKYEVEEAEITTVEQNSELVYAQGQDVDTSQITLSVTKGDGAKHEINAQNDNLTYLELDGNHILSGDILENKVLKTVDPGFHNIKVSYEERGKKIEGVIRYKVAFKENVDDFDFSYSSQGATITGLKAGYKKILVAPASIKNDGKTYSVIGIANGAFAGKDDIIRMYIPNTIKKIGERAFEGCTQLESVQLYYVSNVVIDGEHKTTIDSDIFKTQLVEYEEIHKTEATITGIQFVNNIKKKHLIIPDKATINAREIKTHDSGYEYEARYQYIADIRAEKSVFEDENNILKGITVSIPSTQYFIDLLECEVEEIEVEENGTKVKKKILKKDSNGNPISKNEKLKDKFASGQYRFYNVGSLSNDTQIMHLTFNEDYKTKDSEPKKYSKHKIVGTQNEDAILSQYDLSSGKIIAGKYLKNSNEKDVHELVAYTKEAFDGLALNEGKKLYLADSISQGEYLKYVGVYNFDEKKVRSEDKYFSNTVEDIGVAAFKGAKLNNFKFTASDNALRRMGSEAFAKTQIEEVDLSGSKLQEINSDVFRNCEKLTTVKLSDNIKHILKSAFEGCKELKTFEYDFSKLEAIYEYAFKGCVKFDKTFELKQSALKGNATKENVFEGSNAHVTWK